MSRGKASRPRLRESRCYVHWSYLDPSQRHLFGPRWVRFRWFARDPLGVMSKRKLF